MWSGITIQVKKEPGHFEGMNYESQPYPPDRKQKTYIHTVGFRSKTRNNLYNVFNERKKGTTTHQASARGSRRMHPSEESSRSVCILVCFTSSSAYGKKTPQSVSSYPSIHIISHHSNLSRNSNVDINLLHRTPIYTPAFFAFLQ